MGIKGKEHKPLLNDPRSPEEILAEDPPAADEPDATEKTAIRFAYARQLQQLKNKEEETIKTQNYSISYTFCIEFHFKFN